MGPALQRCGHSGEQVNTQLRNAMAQHQKWNQGCVTWQYHNKATLGRTLRAKRSGSWSAAVNAATPRPVKK